MGCRGVLWCFLALVWLLDATSGVKEGQLLLEATPATGATAVVGVRSRLEALGYTCGEHNVTTQDGYILGMQRIPAGRSSGSEGVGGGKVPVLLQHGILTDGFIWLINSPDQSLGFVLADSGFDVWIANSRATASSRGHTSLTTDDPAYWDWTWDELNEYDLPAMVSYVYSQTGQKIHYVGDSLGTLIGLASFSENKLANMVRSAGLLTPIAYTGHVSFLLKAATDFFLGDMAYFLGVNEFNPHGKIASQLVETLCTTPGVQCEDLMSFLTVVRTDTISKFDYGLAGNLKRYSRLLPPAYNMSGIPRDLPLFFSYGGLDELSDSEDAERLFEILTSNGNDFKVHYVENYAHMDFILGIKAKGDVYDPLMSFLKQH